MRQFLSALVTFLLALLPVKVFAQASYSIPDIENETVIKISSIPDGRLLFSTLRGMFLYDGKTVTTLVPDSNMNDFFVDGNDIFFINEKGLGRYGLMGKIDLSSIRTDYRNLCNIDEDLLVTSSAVGLEIYGKKDLEQKAAIRLEKSFDAPIEYSSRRGEILTSVKDSLILVKKDFSSSRKIPVGGGHIQSIVSPEWSDGVFIGTSDGLFYLRDSSYQVEKVTSVKGNVLYMESSKEGYIAVGVKDSGISIIYSDWSVENILPHEKLVCDKCVFHVSSIDLDDIWISENCSGIERYSDARVFDPKYSKFVKTFNLKRVWSIFENNPGDIWVFADHQIYRFNKKTGNIAKLAVPGFSPDEVFDFMTVTSSHELWLTAAKRAYCYSITETGLVLEHSFSIGFSTIGDITEGLDGTVYFTNLTQASSYSNERGLKQISPDDVPVIASMTNGLEIRASYYYRRQGNSEWIYEKMLPEGETSYFFNVDSKGNIWLISNTNVIYKYNIASKERQKFELSVKLNPFTGEEDLGTFSIEEDLYGNMWFGSNSGLIRIDPITGNLDFFNTGRKFDYYRASLIDSDGIAYFGYSNGITVFDPKDTSSLLDNDSMSFMIDRITLNNSFFGIVGTDNVLRLSDGNVQETLPRFSYNENNLSISFSCIDFDQRSIPFMYILEGKDKDWTTTTNTSVDYSGLENGKYTFKMKMAGMPDEMVKEFSFRIKPALWDTLLARILYVLVFIGGVYFVYRYYKKSSQERKEKQERFLKEEVAKMKINFFTNISHELRTPLSLIVAPLKDVRKSPNLSDSDKRNLDIADRSVHRLLGLTNQLLEYNNVEKDYSKLMVSRKDISKSIHEMLETFGFSASENDITLSQSGENSLVCMFDEVKVTRIMSNLLSNAIKYSKKGGHVNVNISSIDAEAASKIYGDKFDSGKWIEIRVEDDGIGIPSDRLEKIFERYERVDDSVKGISGFGIGLHYTRQLVGVHGGAIVAQNNTPAGSVFRFIIPADIKGDSVVEAPEKPSLVADPVKVSSPSSEDETMDTVTGNTVLIVDDETDMREYLHSYFTGQGFNVITACDGVEAVEKLKEEYVDVVLSDVMMPNMDGYQLLSTVKKDVRLSSVPVVLLTAKADLQSNIHGLNLGADAYVVKPFETDYLLAVVRNVLAIRAKRQATVTDSTSETIKKEEFSNTVENETDLKFIEKLYAFLDEHLSESDINIDDIAKEVAMSRTAFYLKIKSLTGKSPLQFFNDYRMNKAVELLKEGKHNIAEIAYMVGYEASQSFSRTFKKKFGCVPSDYPFKKD